MSAIQRKSDLQRSESRKLRELGVRDDITSTAELVRAYNEATDVVEKRLLLRWLGKYVDWFSQQNDVALTPNMVESYARLAGVQCRGAKDRELVKRFFFALSKHVNELNYCKRSIVSALENVLNLLDPKIFADNAPDLLNLAHRLLSMLDPTKQAFTKTMYAQHGVTLFALHQTLVVLHAVAPSQLPEQVVQGLMCTVNEVMKSNAYYPYVYYGRLVKHSIKTLREHNALGPWVGASRRLFHGLYGSLCMMQGMRAVAELSFDVGAVESGVKHIKKAFIDLERDKWTRRLQELMEASLKSLEDDAFGHFKRQLMMKDAGRAWGKEKNGRMRRFCIVSQLRMLAVDGRSQAFREEAMDELLRIADTSRSTDSWLRDPHLLEAMLDALHAVHSKEEHAGRAAAAVRDLAGVTDKTSREKVLEWMGDHKTVDAMLASIIPQENSEDDELFHRMRVQMGLTRTWKDLVENLEDLRSTFTSKDFAEVASFFDEGSPKHVKNFEYDLFIYEEIAVRRRAADVGHSGHLLELVETKQRVRTSVALEDILKPRASEDGALRFVKNRKHLLVGNPGTGKTSISKSFAFGWATGRLGRQFDAVYVLRVRDLTNAAYDDGGRRKEKSLRTAVANKCFPRKNSSDDAYEALRKHVGDDLGRTTTLLILDGLDEGDATGETMVQEALRLDCHVLFTSRPYNLTKIRSEVGREMECLGLSDKQLERFLEAEVPGKGDELIAFLWSTPSIWETAHVPVIASVLCFVWTEKQETYDVEEAIGMSRLGMFDLMVRFIWERYAKKLDAAAKPIPDTTKVFEALEKIAFHARAEGQILISQSLVRKHSPDGKVDGVLRDAGFLLLQQEGMQYQFPHLSFQEFFAGRYLAETLFETSGPRKKKALSFVAANKYKEIHWDTFSFMTQKATDENGDEAFEEILSIMDQEPCDVLGVQHLLLKLRMVDAYMSIKQEEIEDSDCYTCCEDLMQEASQLFVTLGSQEKHLNVVVHHASQSLNIVKTFPELINPIVEQLINEPTSQRLKKLNRTAGLARSFPEVRKSFEDLLQKQLESEDGSQRNEAVSSLVHLANLSSDVPEFIFDLMERAAHDPSQLVRQNAASTAEYFIKTRTRQSSRFWRLLHDGCFDVNSRSRAWFICHIARSAASGGDLAAAAWKLLTEEGEDDSTLLDRVINDKDQAVRCRVVEAVVQCASEVQDRAMTIQTALSCGCRDPSWSVRLTTARQLGKLAQNGPENAKLAWKLFKTCVEDSDEAVRVEALQQVPVVIQAAAIDEAEALRPLEDLYETDEQLDVRIVALQQIAGFIREATEETGGPMEILTRAFVDPSDHIREEACSLLTAVCRDVPSLAPHALTILKPTCEDSDDWLRKEAIRSILEVSSLTDSTVEDVSDVSFLACEDPVWWIREEANQQRRYLKMDEGEKKEDRFESLLKRIREAKDEEALFKMAKIPGAAEDRGESMVEAASLALEDQDERVRQGGMEVLANVIRRIFKIRDVPSYSGAAMKLLFKAATDAHKEVKSNAMKLIQGAPFKDLLEYYSSTHDEKFVSAVTDRLVNVAATVSKSRGGREAKLVIHEASNNDEYKGPPEEVESLVSLIKSAGILGIQATETVAE